MTPEQEELKSELLKIVDAWEEKVKKFREQDIKGLKANKKSSLICSALFNMMMIFNLGNYVLTHHIAYSIAAIMWGLGAIGEAYLALRYQRAIDRMMEDEWPEQKSSTSEP